MALLLTESDVRELLPIPDLISAMELALAAFSGGDVRQPVRTAIQVGADRAFFGLMPAYVERPAALGAKLVTVFEANAKKGLPTHLATILLLDPETGALLAVMDGRYITQVRTAAVSAVAVQRLARADGAVLAILGSGVQARSHVEVLRHVRQFPETRAWSPTAEHLRRFATESRVQPAADAEEAVRDAGVVVIATSSAAPVIENDWVAPGTLVISLGAYRPDMREMDSALVLRARVFVDSRAAAVVEAGDIVQNSKEISGELGEVILGRVPGRTSEQDVVIFKSLGMAVEDVAAAHLVYDRARQLGKGTEIRV